MTIIKPAGATVRGAYLAYATTGFTGTALTEPIYIDGSEVPIANQLANGIGSYNYFANVTDLVDTQINSYPAGPVPITVEEPNPALVDGEILTVVFNDPNVTVDRTVSIMYGALQTQGDTYSVGLARPIDLSDPSTRLQMSLGISYSYQDDGTPQYSTVDVNGKRLTSSAGGEDDGAPYNGALITAGGVGDDPADPADPYALPTGPRSDDELYDLRPFVSNGDSTITVKTSNPSNDDNVFLAVFDMNPPVTGVVTNNGPAAQVLIVHGVTQDARSPIFASLQDEIKTAVPSASVSAYAYFQDKSAQLPDGSCDISDSTQTPPVMPANTAGMPYDASQNSGYCDSEGDIGQNAIRLENTIRSMYQANGKKVILVGYSMGGETIRSFLAYSTAVGDGVAANMVDSVVTLHGVQQGSWLAGAGAYAFLGLPPWARTQVNNLIGQVAPNPNRPATQEFNPLGGYLDWVHANSANLPNIPYYNTWGDEHLGTRHCLILGHLCVSSQGGSWGDVILLPGNDDPTKRSVGGGARFAPRGYTASSWQWAEHFTAYYDPFDPLSIVDGIKALIAAPQQHSNVPNHQQDVTVHDCRDGSTIQESHMIAQVIIARLNGATLQCNPAVAE